MRNNLIVLGIDAASAVLLRRWTTEGKLPAFQRLMQQGTSGWVSGVKGFYIGSTWPSFYTGLNPANHGFYRIEQIESASYRFFRPLESSNGIGGIPFWKQASDAGRRVVVLDVPLSQLDPDLNGMQLVEWGGHDSVFGFRASPAALVDEIQSGVGAYPLPSTCDGRRKNAGDFEQFVAGLEAAVDKKLELTLKLLERETWNLFVQVFTEAHCAGHQCWHIHDATHPSHDPHVRAVVGDPLERVYRAIDRAVGAIAERAGNSRILVVSAHGMGAFRGADFLLPEILYRLGVTARPSNRTPQGRTAAHRVAGTLRTTWRKLPRVARESLRPLRTRLVAGFPGISLGSRLPADVTRSQCFPVPNGSAVSGIRLNLAGREPHGVLQPGRESDAFCEQLAQDLSEIIDERTGKPLVANVERTDALYRGKRQDALPDLLVEWDDTVATGTFVHAGGRGAMVRATSEKIGLVEGTNKYGRTGEHVSTGMFICAGPGIRAGARKEPVSVMDMHPSICKLLDLPLPNVDGEVIPELAHDASGDFSSPTT
ncbi:MAG: alkaline phosphatase family protein [Pseudomonadota bacterium]